MDLYHNTFKLARYTNSENTPSGNDAAIRDMLEPLSHSIRCNHPCTISFSRIEGSDSWLFTLFGTLQTVMAAKAILLRDSPLQHHRTTIKVSRQEILDQPTTAPRLKTEVRKQLDEVASVTGAHISVINPNHPLTVSEQQLATGWSSMDSERTCELLITGKLDSVDAARVRLLVMLDKLGGLHADSVEIDYKLLCIVAKRKRAAIQEVQEGTATNIYYPSPLHGLTGLPGTGKTAASLRSMLNVVWITGDFLNVQRAKEKLLKASLAVSSSILSREVILLPRKIDWMLQDRSDDLKTIMSDNGAFIAFPQLGSQGSQATVYGDQRSSIQRTTKSLMGLAVHIYIATFWLLPLGYNALMPPPSLNPNQVTATLEAIVRHCDVEAVYKKNLFEFHGLEADVRAAIARLREMDVVKMFGHEIHFQIELATEHRDFISGKKNGKINKIMQNTSVSMKFETFNDYNFLISVQGTDKTALQGLSFLQEELPAEISFHVPEIYHKRIIGVGGKNIQKIMKRFGTFVKFSNAEEYASLGGYHNNDDNVLARTPTKNAINLENLRLAIMELVHQKDKDYMTERVDVPRRYHRSLLGEIGTFVHDIERKTGCRIRFPDRELALDHVDIFGPEATVHVAGSMLLDHVPFEAEMTVPPSGDLAKVVNSAHFIDFAEKIKRELQVTIMAHLRGVPEQSIFKFHCQRSNADYLGPARELLETYLVNSNIHIYVPNAHRRADSFADAFPHFNSRVLSSAVVMSDTGSTARPVRMANSTPDVKALFKNAGYVLAEGEETEDRTARYSGVSYRPPSDYWPQPVAGRPGLINAPRDEEALKRGSDSLLEAKLKEYAKPRQQAMQLRAKSLDLTQLARINEGVADAVEEEGEYEGEYEEIDETEIGEPLESPNGVNGTHVLGRASYPLGAPGTRMSAPAGHPRPHAVRIASGLSDDLIRQMRIR